MRACLICIIAINMRRACCAPRSRIIFNNILYGSKSVWKRTRTKYVPRMNCLYVYTIANVGKKKSVPIPTITVITVIRNNDIMFYSPKEKKRKENGNFLSNRMRVGHRGRGLRENNCLLRYFIEETKVSFCPSLL